MAIIGVLDSGVGGLSVLREIHRLLPGVPTLYYADQGHVPYGPRPVEEIRGFVEDITRFLIDQGAATIVLACNAASAAALTHLRSLNLGIPIVGMEPAVKPANGILYRNLLTRYAPTVKIMTQIAPELVRMVEENSYNTPQDRRILADTLAPLLDAGADHIALACTHFPFLKDAIREMTGGKVTLVDPSPAVARQVARVFPADGPTTSQDHRYFTSGNPDHLNRFLHYNTDSNCRANEVESIGLAK
jgi:glutamate racemase